MANYRRGRINEEMMKETAMILREVKDPRVSDAFISVTGAEVTADLKYAKIFYSAMRGDKKEVTKGLKAATGFIRREIARRLNLRITPELSFVEDTSIAYGAHISEILSKITYAPETEEAGSAEEENSVSVPGGQTGEPDVTEEKETEDGN